MSTTTEDVRTGKPATAQGSNALRVASRGLSSMRDLANFTIAHSIDVLQGQIGVREGNTSLRAISETRKVIVDGQKVGYTKSVIDAPPSEEGERLSLLQREAELTAELEAIRERRGATKPFTD